MTKPPDGRKNDLHRKFPMVNGRTLMVGKWRDGFSVSISYRGAFHAIGGFGTRAHGIHAFRTGVKDGQRYQMRLDQVIWASELAEDKLPTKNIDPHWKATCRYCRRSLTEEEMDERCPDEPDNNMHSE